MRQLPPADRFSDARDDNPYWNESVWFSFSKPERRLHGFVQYYFRPNMGMLNGGPVMWDPSGTFQWNCLYYNWSHLQAMPPGAEKFDMTARNSLTLKPAYDVLLDRVAQRTIDKRLPAAEIYGDEGLRRAVEKLDRLRPWFYESVYANGACDLEIDTVRHSPEQVCDLIEQRLAEGPGTSFDALRKSILSS
jgi:hypothetical protein